MEKYSFLKMGKLKTTLVPNKKFKKSLIYYTSFSSFYGDSYYPVPYDDP
jgi:hypothetical protein